MKTIKIKYYDKVPDNFTGIAEHVNGTKRWLVNGELHREDGPAVEHFTGVKVWWLNSKLHRETGPAVEYPNGKKEWYLNDELHREDGPAVEFPDGTKYWHLNGKEVDEKTVELFYMLKYKKEIEL